MISHNCIERAVDWIRQKHETSLIVYKSSKDRHDNISTNDNPPSEGHSYGHQSFGLTAEVNTDPAAEWVDKKNVKHKTSHSCQLPNQYLEGCRIKLWMALGSVPSLASQICQQVGSWQADKLSAPGDASSAVTCHQLWHDSIRTRGICQLSQRETKTVWNSDTLLNCSHAEFKESLSLLFQIVG